jgi:hypothetical protein
MTAHSLTHAEATRRPVRRGLRNGRFQLGWAHFWLLVSILGGILGVIAFVLVAMASL